MTNPGVIIEYGDRRAGTVRDGSFLENDGDEPWKKLTDSVIQYTEWENNDRGAAVHEIASLDDLDVAQITAAGGPSAAHGEERADVRVYEQVGWEAAKAGYIPGSAPILLIVGMTMQEGYFDELIRWYEEEHFPLLLKVDGWQRVRRFLRRSGKGPESLTLCEIASIEVFDDPVKLAAATPWRNALAEKRTDYERVIYERS